MNTRPPMARPAPRPGLVLLVLGLHTALGAAGWWAARAPGLVGGPPPAARQPLLWVQVAGPARPAPAAATRLPPPAAPTLPPQAWLAPPTVALAPVTPAPRPHTEPATVGAAPQPGDLEAPPGAVALASSSTRTDHGQTAELPSPQPGPAAAQGPVAFAARQGPDHRDCARAPYPAMLRERGIQGELTLRVHVTADGRAAQVLLLASSGWRLFDEAALAQVRACRFRPAQVDGRAVADWVELPVRFALDG